MKVGQKKIGQKSYGVMSQLSPSFSKVVPVEYGENRLKNFHYLVFQPQLNTTPAACIRVAFLDREWNQLCHYRDQQLVPHMLKYSANMLFLQCSACFQM